jgi:acetyltransferase-like isoleucine patch superfamily enzyme
MINKKGAIHSTALIGEKVTLGVNVTIEPYVIVHDGVEIGDNVFIGANSIIGEPIGGSLGNENFSTGTKIGNNSILRSGSIIYQNVITAENFESGHRVTIREGSRFGKNNRVGTLCDIQGDCEFGNYVRLHSNVHIGKTTKVGNFVFIFPYVVATNDPHPPSNHLCGVTIKDFAVIATSSVLLPGVTIGAESLVGAMSLVKNDVPDGMVVVGNPAKVIFETTRIRNKFNPENSVYPWKHHFDRGMPWEGVGYEKWAASVEADNK